MCSKPSLKLGGRFGYFLFFSARGGGRGSPRRQEGGGGIHFLLKIPGGGGFQEGPRGREGVCGELGNLGGGGAKYFFSGPKRPPSKFVKKFLRFSFFRPGYWEEKSTKAHEKRPEKCSMVTSGNQRRLIGN